MTVIFPDTLFPESAPLPVPGDPTQPTLADMDDLQLLALVGSLPQASERRDEACEQLVDRYRGLVWSCAHRYGRGAELTEDLVQVGYVGLMKAINKFDPAFGRGLAAFALPCVAGEIKRHFRDRRWQIHVKRPAKELAMEVRAVFGELTQELGRTPGDADLARYLKVSAASLRDAQLADMALHPSSLDAPLAGRRGTFSLADLVGDEDPRIEHLLSMRAVATHWGELPAREQEILMLRFRGELTQAQIGQQLGISQMHVSRLLAHSLGYLRQCLLGMSDRT